MLGPIDLNLPVTSGASGPDHRWQPWTHAHQQLSPALQNTQLEGAALEAGDMLHCLPIGRVPRGSHCLPVYPVTGRG